MKFFSFSSSSSNNKESLLASTRLGESSPTPRDNSDNTISNKEPRIQTISAMASSKHEAELYDMINRKQQASSKAVVASGQQDAIQMFCFDNLAYGSGGGVSDTRSKIQDIHACPTDSATTASSSF
jgi:hypothetical protein